MRLFAQLTHVTNPVFTLLQVGQLDVLVLTLLLQGLQSVLQVIDGLVQLLDGSAVFVDLVAEVTFELVDELSGDIHARQRSVGVLKDVIQGLSDHFDEVGVKRKSLLNEFTKRV